MSNPPPDTSESELSYGAATVTAVAVSANTTRTSPQAMRSAVVLMRASRSSLATVRRAPVDRERHEHPGEPRSSSGRGRYPSDRQPRGPPSGLRYGPCSDDLVSPSSSRCVDVASLGVGPARCCIRRWQRTSATPERADGGLPGRLQAPPRVSRCGRPVTHSAEQRQRPAAPGPAPRRARGAQFERACELVEHGAGFELGERGTHAAADAAAEGQPPAGGWARTQESVHLPLRRMRVRASGPVGVREDHPRLGHHAQREHVAERPAAEPGWGGSQPGAWPRNRGRVGGALTRRLRARGWPGSRGRQRGRRR